MLKKRITYTNFEDEEVTETFYFNLTKADLMEMEVSKRGGLNGYIERIQETNDAGLVFEELKSLMSRSVGRLAPDGRGFSRSQQIRDEFMNSEAFSNFILEMLTDPQLAAEFIQGLIPKNIESEVDRIVKKLGGQETLRVEPRETTPEPPKQVRKITKAEALEMDSDELNSLIATGAVITD